MSAMAPPWRRIVAIVPNPVGDAVMFTPALRAIRARFADSELALFARPAPAAVLAPNPWGAAVIVDPGGLWTGARALRAGGFDLAVLGPNSFRSALLVRLAGIPNRVGYHRDGRGWLLTEKVAPPRDAAGRLAVVPAVDYYLGLTRALGCQAHDRRMELAVDGDDCRRADTLLADGDGPVVVLSPGAAFGPSKMYPPERFAAVADELVRTRGARVVISVAPGERGVGERLATAMRATPVVNLAEMQATLGLVKALIARAAVVITNDTGPRHVAAALGAGVVTVFGPTDPARTTIDYDQERTVVADADCAPCQRKVCPLPAGADYHRCMRSIPPEAVLAAAEELLDEGGER